MFFFRSEQHSRQIVKVKCVKLIGYKYTSNIKNKTKCLKFELTFGFYTAGVKMVSKALRSLH